MFGLAYSLWKYWNQKSEFNILILGLDNAGKTTFLELAKAISRISNRDKNSQIRLPKIHNTVGLNIGKIAFDDIILNFWDLGGQNELQCLWENYYGESHMIVYMIDASNRERLKETKEAFDKILFNKATVGLPVLFIANNKNKEDFVSFEEIEQIFDFKNTFVSDYKPFHFTMISKLNGQGIKECLDWIQVTVKSNAHLKPPIVSEV